ncbi:MAG: hypothetical protein AVDCRST_MAG64-2826, partial [uncultured Phycisphaerae bacterium]
AEVPVRGFLHAGRHQGRAGRWRHQEAGCGEPSRRGGWGQARELPFRVRRSRCVRRLRAPGQRERHRRRAHGQRGGRSDGEDRGAADPGGGRRRREALGRLPGPRGL